MKTDWKQSLAYNGGYLGDKYQTECACGAKNDEDRYDDEGDVLLIGQDGGYGCSNHTHDDDVVHTHAYGTRTFKERY